MQFNLLQSIAIYLVIGCLFSRMYCHLCDRHRKDDYSEIYGKAFDNFIFILTLIFWPFVLIYELKFFWNVCKFEVIQKITNYKAKRKTIKILKSILKDDPDNQFVKDKIKEIKNL